MCPLVDVLREEVRGDPGGNPKRLAGGELHGRRTQGGGGHGAALGEPLHAFCPARGDCADLGAFDADRDPWAGDLEGLGGEGTVATARAWISPGAQPAQHRFSRCALCTSSVFLVPARTMPYVGGSPHSRRWPV